MKCLSCKTAEANILHGLCYPCQTLYTIGMLSSEISTSVSAYLSSDSYNEANQKPIEPAAVNSSATCPHNNPKNLGCTMCISDAIRNISSEDRTSRAESSASVQTLSTPTQIDEKLAEVKKTKVQTLFLSAHEQEILKQPTHEQAIEVAKTDKINVRVLFTLQEHYESHPPAKSESEQLAAAINRPSDIDAIAQEQRILSGEEIARISLAREQSLNRVIAMIKQQGEHNGFSVPDRVEEQLSVHIHEIQKKIAELRLCETVAKRVRRNYRAEEIEKLTPEELEEFKKRAKNPKKAKSQEDLIRKAKKDAAEHYSKEMKQAAKHLDNLGEKGIKLCVDLFGVTEEDCLNHLAKKNGE